MQSLLSCIENLSVAQRECLQDQNPLGHTQRVLNDISALISAGKKAPDSLLAYAFLHDDSSIPLTLALRAACLYIFLGLRLQFNDQYLQHLASATFLCLTLRQAPKDRLNNYLQCWQLKHLRIMIAVMKVAKAADASTPARYLNENKLGEEQLWFIGVLTLLKSPALHFKSKLREVICRFSAGFHQGLDALLYYPGDWMPGAAVAFRKGGGFILYRLSADTILVWNNSTQKPEERLSRHLSITDDSPLSLTAWQDASGHADARFAPRINQLIPESYPVSKLPSELKAIIIALHDDSADIPYLARRIENIPVFANYLKETASVDNRLQLPVRDVKQAILTYGLTRVADMLILRALTQRLHQRHFPLLGVCTRFSAVVAATSAELAVQVSTPQTPQTAALLATFATAPLFTLAGLKTLLSWPRADGNLYDLNSLWQSKQQPLLDMSTALARQWQQTPRYQAVILHCGLPVNDIPRAIRAEALVIGLAVLLSRHWLFGAPVNTASDTYKKQAMSALALSYSQLDLVYQSVCPLLALPYQTRL